MSCFIYWPYAHTGKSFTSQLHSDLFHRANSEPKYLDFLGSPVLQRIKEKYVLGETSFFFDMDGTLTSGEPGVHETDADNELHLMLQTMYQHLDEGVAIVTGRPNYYMENLLPQSDIPVMTEFGAVYRRSSQDHIQHRINQPKLSKEIELVRKALSQSFEGIDGVRVEDHKQLSVTVEFTKAANVEAVEAEIEERCNSYLSRQSAELHDHFYVRNTSVPHNRVIDILPIGKDKGEALGNLLCQDEFSGKVPVFFGDSSGDAPGMDVAQKNDGWAIGVGEGAPEQCDYVFKDMGQLHAFLLDIMHARDVAVSVNPPVFNFSRHLKR